MSGGQAQTASQDDPDVLLDRLVAAYDRGLLVPFIGAGMSHDACHLWPAFVEALEQQAGLRESNPDGDPVYRAARAVRRLRLGSGTSLAEAVRSALSARPGPQEPPPQTTALANLFWPLVLTTNYDDLYLAAAHRAHLELRPRINREERRESPLLLLGRSPRDCQRVLTSLRQPDLPILWALQGFVGGQATALGEEKSVYQEYVAEVERHRGVELEAELVVGHAEYRRVAMASEAFRRAFGEVYRSRSLLLLGSGLKDKYFLDLFSEIIEFYGPSPHPHYAILKTGQYDESFLRQFFGIWVLPIRNNDELPTRLKELKERIEGAGVRRLASQFGSPSRGRGRSSLDPAGLRVLRGPLPKKTDARACLAISAGGTPGQLKLSHAAKEIGVDVPEAGEGGFKRLQDFETYGMPLWHFASRRIIAVNARLDPWTGKGARIRPTDPLSAPIGERKRRTASARILRDVRIIPYAVEELLQAAQALGYRHVHAMLLAAGPLRTFPRSYALLQMARGWARWDRPTEQPGIGLSIHVVAPDVLYDLDSGRLDLARYLRSDVIEFWLEIEKRGGDIERYLHVGPADQRLLQVIGDFDIEDDDWTLQLTPQPCLRWSNWSLGDVKKWEGHFPDATLDVSTFGVLPGSTLTLIEPTKRAEA